MTGLYQGFAEAIERLNAQAVGTRMTTIGHQRAYLVDGKPYFDNVHFPRVSESWVTHEALQTHILHTPALHGRIWAGTAGEVNLSYMAVSRASAAILYDINPLQTVFWQRFFALLAETPDPHDFGHAAPDFIKSLYFELTDTFNLQASRDDYPYLHMRSPDPEDKKPYEEGMRFDPEERSSPVINMNYKQFSQSIRTALGWKDTGYISCTDKEVSWLANPDNYAHLHHMAKARAVAALTLDVSDTESCTQLRASLDEIGDRIGNLYTSNVLYYFDYSEDEIATCRENGTVPRDFAGQEITSDVYHGVLANLRSLTHEDAGIIRFDRTQPGFFGRPDFQPLFEISDPAAISLPQPSSVHGLMPA